MLNLLNELHNAGIKIRIESPLHGWRGEETWEVGLAKDDEGVSLNIVAKERDLDDAVQTAYDKWVASTGRGMPNLTLRQINYDGPLKATDEDDVPPADILY